MLWLGHSAAIGRRQDQQSCSQALGAGSPTPMPPEPTPLCCSVKMQGPFPQVLQPLRGWTCSPISYPHMDRSSMPFPPGPASLCCTGKMQDPVLPSTAAHEEGRASSPTHIHALGPSSSLITKGVEEWGRTSPSNHLTVAGPSLPHISPRVGTPTPLPPETAPVFCLFEMWGLLSRGMPLVRDRASSLESERL